MMLVLGFIAFAGAFGIAGFVIVSSIAPQWRRIAGLAMGHVEPAFAPLGTLALAERRIAVRRWASSSIPAPRPHRREAA